MPCKQRARNTTVPVLEGVNLSEPVVKPRSHQEWVIFGVWLLKLVVPIDEIIKFAVDLNWRAVLVNQSVGSGGIVGLRFEATVVKRSFEPLTELVNGSIRRLIAGQDLVQLLNIEFGEGMLPPDVFNYKFRCTLMVPQDSHEVLRVAVC
jgi:hypothetical protein